MANVAYEMHVIKKDSIRPSKSPGDLVIIRVKDVTLSSSSATVDLSNIIPGGQESTFKVSYLMLKQATASSSSITCTAAVPTASQVVDIVIWFRAQAVQG